MLRRPLTLLLSSLALGLTLFSGCASLAVNHRVGVSVIDVQPTRATLLESGALITLRFTNENPTAILLKGSSHRLYLNGTAVGRAVSNDSVSLPGLGTITQPITVYLDNLTLARKAAEFSSAPTSINYRLESQLFTVDGATLRADSTGQLEIGKLLNLAGGLMSH